MADDLQILRDEFAYHSDGWQKIREQGRIDLLCLSGEIWQALDPDGLKLRDETKRPHLDLDELSQYVNALINDIRQNKRGIRITSLGGADRDALDRAARVRANLIRQIEYRSNAPREAYTTMFENAVQRSYGACRIVAEYVSPRSFDQELLIKSIPNPDLLTPDADGVMADGADMKVCYLHEWWRMDTFKATYPKAKVKGWSADQATLAGEAWMRADRLLLAERWKVTTRKETLLLIAPQGQEAGVQAVYESELKAKGGLPPGYEVRRSREADVPKVTQQLTNGIEILSETSWPGDAIPIALCLGKVMYVDPGGGSERRILSHVRNARTGAMAHNYVATCEIEAIGGVPRAQWVGYEGQFATHETEWEKANKEPVAYLEIRERGPATPPGQTLPPPQRQSWDPPIQNLEIAKESYRRSIQSGMGSNFLPTDAQNRNQKSGVAMDKITSTAQRGSYHFVDHFEGAVSRVGYLLNSLLPHYYDTARDVTVRKPDETPEIIRINDPQAPEPVNLTTGEYDVTISTGPAEDSERAAASDFADTLSGIPAVFPQIADLVIKLKNLGPIGDEIAERLTPPAFRQQPGQKPLPPEARQLMAKVQELQQLLQKAAQDQQADTLKYQTEERIADKRIAFEREKLHFEGEVKIAVAELSAKVDRMQLFLDEQQRIADIAHGREQMAAEGMEATKERVHALTMAKIGQQHALEQADAGVAGQMATQAQAAELQPEPAEPTEAGAV